METKTIKPTFYELTPLFDSAKSFYGKAFVWEDKHGNKVLRSYQTEVAKIDPSDMVCSVYGTYSATTLRHIKEFMRQHGFSVSTKKEVEQYIV